MAVNLQKLSAHKDFDTLMSTIEESHNVYTDKLMYNTSLFFILSY